MVVEVDVERESGRQEGGRDRREVEEGNLKFCRSRKKFRLLVRDWAWGLLRLGHLQFESVAVYRVAGSRGSVRQRRFSRV